MKAQLALLECEPPLHSDRVDPERVPASIRDEFVRRYQDESSGKLKVPLSGAYRLLAELGHPAGKHFFDHKDQFDKILSARNDSILAHGITVQQKASCESFLKLLESMVPIAPPSFPRLDLAKHFVELAR